MKETTAAATAASQIANQTSSAVANTASTATQAASAVTDIAPAATKVAASAADAAPIVLIKLRLDRLLVFWFFISAFFFIINKLY